MSAWLSKLLLSALKYIWPLILDEFKDWAADELKDRKDKRERAKATEEAKEAYGKVANNPASTPKAKADANKDLINN